MSSLDAYLDENSQAEIADFILKHLPSHSQFALGTVDESGKPWVVCLNLAYDKKLNIIWKSNKNAEHSKHVRGNPNVAVCVFSETKEIGDFGFYSKALAHEVTDESELKDCLDARYKAKGKEAPPLSKFQGESPDRIYIAKLKEAWVTDKSHQKIKVDLEMLRNKMRQK